MKVCFDEAAVKNGVVTLNGNTKPGETDKIIQSVNQLGTAGIINNLSRR